MAREFFKNYPTIQYGFDGTTTESVTNIMVRAKIKALVKENSRIFYEYTLQEGDTPEIIAYKYYENVRYHWLVMMMNDIKDGRYDIGLDSNKFAKYVTAKYPGVVLNVTLANGSVANGARIRGLTSGATGEVIEWNPGRKTIQILEKTGSFQRGESAETVLIRDTIKYKATISFGQQKVGAQQAVHHYEDTVNNAIIDYEQYLNTPSGEKRVVSNYTYELEENEKKRTINLIKPQYVDLVEEEIKNFLNQNKVVV